MSRERSAWSSKGMVHAAPAIPKLEVLVQELEQCWTKIQDNAPYEAAVLKAAIGRLQDRSVGLGSQEDNFSNAGLCLTASAQVRRDYGEKIGWAELRDREEIMKSLLSAGTLLHEFVRLVIRRNQGTGVGCTIDDVLAYVKSAREVS